MMKSIRFYNNNDENIILLTEEQIEKIKYIQGMKVFYKTIPDQINIYLDGFNINTIHHLFYNKSVEMIIKNIDIVDYLCLSISELFSNIQIEILDLIPFISYLIGENLYLDLLINNQDNPICHDHARQLFNILSFYCGGSIHPIIYGYFENYLLYLYDSVWKILDIDLFQRQKLVIYKYDYLNNIIKNHNVIRDFIFERNMTKDIYWRDTPSILEYLRILTNGFISDMFFEFNPGLTLTGGLISALLSMTYNDLDDYIMSSSPDLDIFVVSNTKIGRIEVINDLLNYLKTFKCFYAYYNSIISIFIKGSRVPIQIILSDYYNVFDMLNAFDMSHLQIALNRDDGLVMTLPCYLSHRDRITTYNKLFYIKPYRIVKAMDRGFSISYNREIEYYITLFGNTDDFIELGKYTTRKFPKKFIMRRFLRYLGKTYIRLEKLDIINFIVDGKIKTEGNFRNPVFDKSYSNQQIQLNVDYDYVPIIKNGILESERNTFIFGYNKIVNDGYFYKVIPDFCRNIYMWIMFRQYLDKILMLYPLCNDYNLGIDEKNSLKVLHENFTGKIYNIGDSFVRRVVIYINNVCVSNSTLYIYLGMK